MCRLSFIHFFLSASDVQRYFRYSVTLSSSYSFVLTKPLDALSMPDDHLILPTLV